jgi:hypothetical protein
MCDETSMRSTAFRPVDNLFLGECGVSASSRVIVCSRDFVSSVANMKWVDLLFGYSLLVCVWNRFASVACNNRQVYGHILIVDLAKGYELGLSSVCSAS